MAVLYDTNILIEVIRLSENDKKKFRKLINPKNVDEFISIVSVAEIRSFAIKSGWGEKRNKELSVLLQNITAIDIFSGLLDAYVEIDIFAQGKHPTLLLPNITKNAKSLKGSAINMGKNDIWIAATTKVFDFELVTTDDDFDYLSETFIKLNKIDRDNKGNIIL
jgi:predicted nucleic acid-binding protein